MDLNTVIIGCATALAGTVGLLWRSLWTRVKESEERQEKARLEAEARYAKRYAEQEARHRLEIEAHKALRTEAKEALEKCDASHKQQAERLLDLTASVSKLEGQREAVLAVTESVIRKIDSLRSDT